MTVVLYQHPYKAMVLPMATCTASYVGMIQSQGELLCSDIPPASQ